MADRDLRGAFARPGGLVLLIKGQRADEELVEASSVVTRLRASHDQTIATPAGRIVVLRRNAAARAPSG